MKKYFNLVILLFVALIFVVGCKKDAPVPTATFTATVNDGVVSFAATVTNDTKYEWDFGDGSYINTIKAPVHTYSQLSTPQNINVSLTINGPGGEVTVKQVVVVPAKTKMQYLTGGKDASKSRKWRLSSTAAVFAIAYANANFNQLGSYPGNILGAVGLAKAYGDEFVFKGDGTMTVVSKGGGIFASMAYCMGTGTAMAVNYSGGGIAYTSAFTAPTGATFTINENKNYVLPTPIGDVTYSGVMTLSFTNGGFLGIKDFTSECIIKKITDTSMDAVIFYAHPSYGVKPMLCLLATFEAI
jgi:PKD repeat protein